MAQKQGDIRSQLIELQLDIYRKRAFFQSFFNLYEGTAVGYEITERTRVLAKTR